MDVLPFKAKALNLCGGNWLAMNIMRYEAILFDMDGVVVDTHQSVTTFWLRLAADHGISLTQQDFVQHVYGSTGEHTLRYLFPHFTEQQRQAVYVTMEEYERNLCYEAVPGVVDLLHDLRREDIPTALVTSGTRSKVGAVTSQLGIDGYFTAQVTFEDIRYGKPDPECYLLAARLLNVSPHACIVFEDAVNGIQAAVAAGTHCIGIQAAYNTAPLMEVGAQAVVPDFTAVTLQVTPQEGPALAVESQVKVHISLMSDHSL